MAETHLIEAATKAEIQARIAGFLQRAEGLVGAMDAFKETLPPETSEPSSVDDVLACIRGELEYASQLIDQSLDYLRPRSDDDTPEVCAHRALQALEVRP